MDLNAIKPVENILEIVHPGTNEKLGIKVPLKSLDDPAMKQLKFKIQNDEKNLARRGKSFTAEQVDANTSLLAYTAMSGWDWTGITVIDQSAKIVDGVEIPAVTHFEPATFHGEKPTFNQPTVFKVFDELSWFRDQITEKVGDTKSFFTI